MTLAGDPASGHAHTCRKQRSTIVTPPTMLLHRRRPPSRSLRAQHISKCCATPCTSDSPSRGAHRPCDEVTRSMQLCDPEKSRSGHFMLQQHAFGTEHTRAGTPSRAPIYRKYLRAGLTFAHVCTRPCSLIPLGPGSLKKTEVTDRALVRCLGIEVARVGLDLRTEPRRLESAPWRSRRSASRCKPLALGLVAPGPTHLTF
jgi:hypothetical protein